jgi:peptidoglycan/xylan/chitin deacetylase (PgdA/CDA1 family)
LLILFALGAALFVYGSFSSLEEAERSQSAEQSRQEPSSTAKPDQSTDEAWSAASAQDASPGIATPGETMVFGHRIALTFDDGPDPATTPAILDVLRDYDIKATFFVIGARAEQHPELIERIVSEGHTLGNHTYYHRDMTKLAPDLMLKELQDTQAVIDQALGNHVPITLFRPPCAAPYNTETDKLPEFQRFMQKQKMYPVMWNIDPRDWELRDQPGLVVDNVVQSTPEGGGIVLLHDTQPQTVDALPRILDYYTAANFQFTGVRDLLAEKYGVDPGGIQTDPSTTQPGATPQPGASGDRVPGDLSSLAECLTYSDAP